MRLTITLIRGQRSAQILQIAVPGLISARRRDPFDASGAEDISFWNDLAAILKHPLSELLKAGCRNDFAVGHDLGASAERFQPNFLQARELFFG